jgi:hypothetical protein
MKDRDKKKVSYMLYDGSNKVKEIEAFMTKKLDKRVSVIKCKITKTTLFPSMIDIETFGDDAMPVVSYKCKLRVLITGSECKITGTNEDTEIGAIYSAINKIIAQNDKLHLEGLANGNECTNKA